MRYTLPTYRRSRAKLWAAALSALLVPTGLRAQDPAPKADPKPADPVVAALVEAHNKERAEAGLPPLTLESKLEEAARAHARDMADRDILSHEGGDGSTPSRRVVRAGYYYLLTGENVAAGQRDVPSVMRSWMDSPPHKKNILGEFTQIGVARVEAKDGSPFWCADFGKPMPKSDPATAGADLVKRVNAERSGASIPALTVDARLAGAAQKLAADLAKKKGQGGTPTRFEGLDERKYQEIAMTTAAGQPDADAVVKSLLESPDYKARLLGKSSKVGTGYATAEDGIPYWVLILATPARQ